MIKVNDLTYEIDLLKNDMGFEYESKVLEKINDILYQYRPIMLLYDKVIYKTRAVVKYYFDFYNRNFVYPLDLSVLLLISGFSEIGKEYQIFESSGLDKELKKYPYGMRSSQIFYKHFGELATVLEKDDKLFYARDAIKRLTGWRFLKDNKLEELIAKEEEYDKQVITYHDRYFYAAWTFDNIAWLSDISSNEALRIAQYEKATKMMFIKNSSKIDFYEFSDTKKIAIELINKYDIKQMLPMLPWSIDVRFKELKRDLIEYINNPKYSV